MDDLNVTQTIIPNLTITVDADSSDVIGGLEITETLEDSRNNESENETNSFEKDYVEVQRAWMKSLNLPKRYENKDGGFFTGVDLSCDVLLNKLEKRAERFGLEKKEETITRKEIDEVYKSLGIEPEDTNPSKLKNIRLETLHMRGVDNMNTRDVFAYFQDYAPSAVEWINDSSCNVVWFDAVTTARAMIGMSQPFRAKKKSAVNPELSESSDKVIETNISETEVARESSTSKETDDKSTEMNEMSKSSMELDEGSYSGKSDEESETKSSSSVLADVDVPIPPGYWRLGVPHPKAKAILFRFATKDDKKLPGAEKRSHYYQKHGNPNYGGLKGLISSSRKRKMQAARNRQEIGKFADDFQSLQQVDKPGFGEKRKTLNTKQSKVRRMRMYADDEEEKMKKKSILHNKSGSKFRSVHSRLGTKYTYDDLINLGKKFSSESEEEEDDNISISCTVPSHNVWTDIAKEMAKESQSEGSESDDHEESRSYKKSSRYGKFDDFSPFQDSGSWKSSRGQSSQDLRSTLTSQRKEFSHNEPHEDLRSKIKRLKRDDSVSKHRSPMFRDD